MIYRISARNLKETDFSFNGYSFEEKNFNTGLKQNEQHIEFTFHNPDGTTENVVIQTDIKNSSTIENSEPILILKSSEKIEESDIDILKKFNHLT